MLIVVTKINYLYQVQVCSRKRENKENPHFLKLRDLSTPCFLFFYSYIHILCPLNKMLSSRIKNMLKL